MTRHRRTALFSTLLAAAAVANAQTYEAPGIEHNMPIFAPALKAKMTYPMAWSPDVKDLKAWRDKGRAKVWEATLQQPDDTPFKAEVIAEEDRGSYVARQVVFNLTGMSRVRALLLVPKAAETALANNTSTFALLQMKDVVGPKNYLADLQAKGYTVDSPK
jgi:hypothetical protein